MAEWLKAHAWKACVRETVPWVRIPLSPPYERFCAPTYDLDHFVRDSALLGLDACAGRNHAGIAAHTIVAQVQNAIVRSVRPDTLGSRSHLAKVAAALSVVSGAAPPRSCEGSLVVQSGCSVDHRFRLSAAFVTGPQLASVAPIPLYRRANARLP